MKIRLDLNSVLVVGKLICLMVVAVVIGLNLVSIPRGEVRDSADDPRLGTEERKNYILAKDIFFYGFFGPLLLSALSILLILLKTKLFILEGFLHLCMFLMAMGLSGFLLFGVISDYDHMRNTHPNCGLTNDTSPFPSAQKDAESCFSKEFEKDEDSEVRIKKTCICIINAILKAKTSMGAGIVGLIYGVFNFGLMIIAIQTSIKAKRPPRIPYQQQMD